MSTTAAASARLPQKLRLPGLFARQLCSGAVGFVMSGASIMLTSAPFGIAWASSVPSSNSLSACIGAAAGYLFLLSGDISVRYVACIAVFLALRWVFSFVSENSMTLISHFLSGATVAATGFAIAISDKSIHYGIIITACETAVTVTASMLFSKAQTAFYEGACLTRSNSVCTGILLCALYMGLSSFSAWGISISNAFACTVILCCGFFASAGVSSAAAVAAGLAAAAAGNPHMLACYCAGGLAGGIFSPLGKNGCCCAFTAATVLTYCAQHGLAGIHYIFLECMLGCAATFLIPPSALKKLGLTSVSDCAEGEMLRRVVTSQLCRIRDALSDISAVTDEVSKKLSEIGSDPIETVFARSCSAVCKGCKSSPRCWQTGYDNTADALNHAFNAAKATGSAQKSDLPPHFECERIDKMLAAINKHSTGYMARRIERRHFSQLRSVSGDQFGGISDLLTAMQNELEQFRCAPPKIAEAVSKYIDSLDCSQSSVCCYLNGDDRISILIELPAYKAPRLLTPAVTADLSEIVMQELSVPEHSPNGAVSRVFWTVKPTYAIESAFFQTAAGHNKFCGDSCRVIRSENDRAVLLLSDGMGVGSPAAVDATLTTSLFERLLRAGADFPSSLRLVNAALLSGGGEERLCTVDAALLDLHNCRLDIFKAGAAPTFLYRRKRCCTVEAQSLPAGILGGAEAKRTSVTLSEGDIIVMLSDGVIETGSEWIPSQIAAYAEGPLDELCKNLISTAHDRRLSDREDDMTVLAAKIVSA